MTEIIDFHINNRDWLAHGPLHELMHAAAKVRDCTHGKTVTYSRKVFIPLTQLCRDVCHYCIFAKRPGEIAHPYLHMEEVLEIARRGAAAGCKEALFTLGDKPELRYRVAREALESMGFASTVDYLVAACNAVIRETGLLPHVNAGVMTRDELEKLRSCSASQGLMLESVSQRLMKRGGAHFGSPDKEPIHRLRMIKEAGELAIPLTSGLLLGIGETFDETIDGFVALNTLHQRYGHLQEVIVQNFMPKADTLFSDRDAFQHEQHLRAIAVGRLILAPEISVQAPPNLSPARFGKLLQAGINDWGGVSPVTPDHVNPEAPWPNIQHLTTVSDAEGYALVERLAVYPKFVRDAKKWIDSGLIPKVLALRDSEGLARPDKWYAGRQGGVPAKATAIAPSSPSIRGAVESLVLRAQRGNGLSANELQDLFTARGRDEITVLAAADELRQLTNGDQISYVINRNINYTNLCTYSCGFCAFSKATSAHGSRDAPYDITDAELSRRAVEAWERGASEVCLQGGIHPDYTGHKYLDVVRTVIAAQPRMHVHAFSPLEVVHGAGTLGLSVHEFLIELKRAGLSTLPGTAAEVLSDEVRRQICPDKLNTEEWLSVMRTAHDIGLRSTATVMFGHVDEPRHWAEHLVRIRDLQRETGGFTEFVPLPFVHDEAPLNRKRLTRHGPTYREAILMHAVSRLALHGQVDHIQTSWVKMGPQAALLALQAGADDFGGTLTNESISRAAGTRHGQELSPDQMDSLIQSIQRAPRVRTTTYADADPLQVAKARSARPADCIELSPVRKGRYRVQAITAA